jgi:hypothetical protein
MKILVRYERAYGNDRFWPLNPVAVRLLRLCRAATFTDWQLRELKELGFEVEIMQELAPLPIL